MGIDEDKWAELHRLDDEINVRRHRRECLLHELTSGLPEFLLARINEAEATAAGCEIVLIKQAHALVECQVKRRLVRMLRHVSPDGDGVGYDAMRLLALPHADHSDYRPVWGVPDARERRS